MTYRFTSIIQQEGKYYNARCVELGVVSQGKSVEDAEDNLKEAVSLYLEDMPKDQVVVAHGTQYVSVLELETHG